MHTSLSIERRIYTCGVCGVEREIETKPIEKWVLVCIHPDSRGTVLPIMQLREEGKRIIDG